MLGRDTGAVLATAPPFAYLSHMSKAETSAAFEQLVEIEIKTLAEILTQGGRSVAIIVVATDGDNAEVYGTSKAKPCHKSTLRIGIPLAAKSSIERLS